MKRSIFFSLIIGFLILLSTTITLADILPEKQETMLTKGENEISMPIDFSPLYASDLVNAYPEIIMITYMNEPAIKENVREEIGYVNIFGGVGEDFIIYGNVTYFITVEKDLEVRLK